MIDELDFVAEHKKADVSKVNRISVNGKMYLAADKVLEIIEEAYFGAGQSEIDYHSRLIEGIGLLKGGEQE